MSKKRARSAASPVFMRGPRDEPPGPADRKHSMNQKAFSYDIVIGLEVHVQLASKTKIFCGCPTTFGAAPNTQVCQICAGYPGTLPVLNARVFELGMTAVLAFGGKVAAKVKFDRKNYFYPDLPKGYQISQYDMPLGEGGSVDIIGDDGKVRPIRLVRLHLEEDAGKLTHDTRASYVDLNRAGVPLAEIVSEPEIKSPQEAYNYLTHLKAIIKAAAVSDADMEKGQLRCDANVSLRKSASDPFGTRVEIKNINSFKNVKAALEYEIARQARVLDAGEAVVQETRQFDAEKGTTHSMRSKEQAHDYRYFPEPDLVPFTVGAAEIAAARARLPELPSQKLERLKSQYALTDYDARQLVENSGLAVVFETLAKKTAQYKSLVNWLIGPVLAAANERSGEVEDMRVEGADIVIPTRPAPEVLGVEVCSNSGLPFRIGVEGLLQILDLVEKGVVSLKVCREDVFPEWIATGQSPAKIIEAKGLGQISDTGALEAACDEALAKNPKSVEDYKAGKENALMFLVGQVMRASKGKANPNLVNELLKKKLS
jgi:aspartyl-tRNA(Asn)/glutamyl-tRNA(Gln) amidotransferase subunit B